MIFINGKAIFYPHMKNYFDSKGIKMTPQGVWVYIDFTASSQKGIYFEVFLLMSLSFKQPDMVNNY